VNRSARASRRLLKGGLSVNSAGGWVKAKKQEQFNYLPHSCNADTFEYKEVAEIAIHKIMKTKRRKKTRTTTTQRG
jgi:hypothetical protein